MKNAKRLYSVLLRLYPHGYRKAFRAQMMQTFLDHYTDVEKSEGHVGAAFWLCAVTDEIKNITEQRMTVLRGGNNLLRVTASQVAVSAALLFPLYAFFYAALVKVLLALPHPPLSGIGVIIALTALFLIPGVFSVAVGHVIISAFASVFSERRVRSV